MADAWSVLLSRTWLSRARQCAALDQAAAKRIGGHRSAARPDATKILPLRATEAAKFLAAVGAGPGNAGYCTLILSLVGELLLCAEDGGILHESIDTRFCQHGTDDWKAVKSIRLLRNAMCHPAAQKPPALIEDLCDFVRDNFSDETWPEVVRGAWALLGGRDVSTFALRQLDIVGHLMASRWGLGKLFARGKGS